MFKSNLMKSIFNLTDILRIIRLLFKPVLLSQVPLGKTTSYMNVIKDLNHFITLSCMIEISNCLIRSARLL